MEFKITFGNDPRIDRFLGLFSYYVHKEEDEAKLSESIRRIRLNTNTLYQCLSSLGVMVRGNQSYGRLDMALLDKLTQDVAAQQTVIQSAVTLITGLSEQLKAAGTDQVQLQAITDQLDQQTATLAAAVAANTPAPVVADAPASSDSSGS